MKWDYWLDQYLHKHCTARGLTARTIAAYSASLQRFVAFVRFRLPDRGPDELAPNDILEYVNYLRRERHNGAAAVNRAVTIIKSFYRAVVGMGHLEPDRNPMAHFPRMKAAPVKLPVFLSEDEVRRLLAQPCDDTILGLRDRALLMLLYGMGIRASECSGLNEGDVDLAAGIIRVTGKGQRQRALPLPAPVSRALALYRQVRGRSVPAAPFFESRRAGRMSRGAIYERVHTHGRRARIDKEVSPHRMRHTFATHLIRKGVQLVTVRDLLGHRCISSTQVYLHTTAEDLRHAADVHPVERLVEQIKEMLPEIRLPLQWPPGVKVISKR